jgi:hypothetical protein
MTKKYTVMTTQGYVYKITTSYWRAVSYTHDIFGAYIA